MLYLKLDIMIFSLIILLITYYYFSLFQKNTRKYLNFLQATTICVILMLTIDIFVNILFNYLINDIFIGITKLLLSMGYILTTLTPWVWGLFLMYYLNPNNPKNKIYAFITSLPFIINTSFVILNLIHPVYFVVNMEEGYHRLDYFFVYGICNTLYLLFSVILIFKDIKNLTFTKLCILLSFEVLPFLGGILQVVFFGTFLLYPAAALATVLIYIYLAEDIKNLDSISKAYSNKDLINFFDNFLIALEKNNYTLVYIDMDNLGKINKEFGEKEGDFVLKKFVEIFNNCFKEPNFITSNGSDEFVIYFDTGNEEEILEYLKILNRNVEYFNKTSNQKYNIKFTFSYFVNNFKNVSPHKILKTLYIKLAIKKQRKLIKEIIS